MHGQSLGVQDLKTYLDAMRTSTHRSKILNTGCKARHDLTHPPLEPHLTTLLPFYKCVQHHLGHIHCHPPPPRLSSFHVLPFSCSLVTQGLGAFPNLLSMPDVRRVAFHEFIYMLPKTIFSVQNLLVKKEFRKFTKSLC